MIFKSKTVNAAIFDMDGTMLDTERLRCKTLTQSSIELFGSPISYKVLHSSLGLSPSKAEELAKNAYGNHYPYIDIRRRADELELATIRSRGIPVKNGLYEVLDRLKKKRNTLGCCNVQSHRDR